MKQKIKKNLSDKDMLKGFVDNNTFEKDKKNLKIVKKTEKTFSPVFIPENIVQKLDKEAFKIRTDFKKQNINDLKWSVISSDDEIIIKVSPVKTRNFKNE